MTDTKKFTVRATDINMVDLDALKQHTRQATANKAIWWAVRQAPRQAQEILRLQAKLQDAQRQLSDVMHTIVLARNAREDIERAAAEYYERS